MFGDNKSVVTSSTIPHSTLGKRWNALSYHRVREAIAGGWLRFEHIPGTTNPADIMTKPLGWNVLRQYVEPMLMWKGETMEPQPGSSNPEGSDTGPGLNGSRVGNESRDGDVVTSMDGGSANANASESAAPAVLPILWNNQYAVLADTDEAT